VQGELISISSGDLLHSFQEVSWQNTPIGCFFKHVQKWWRKEQTTLSLTLPQVNRLGFI
jgi:hypothetical protein